MRRQMPIVIEQQRAQIGIMDREAIGTGLYHAVDGGDLMPFDNARNVLARPQTEQEDGCAGHALSEFQQGGADTLCNELGWPSMPEIIRPNQQHDSLWRRAVQMAVLQPPPQMIG